MNATIAAASACLFTLAPAAAPAPAAPDWAGAIDTDRGKGGMAVTFTRHGTAGWKPDFNPPPSKPIDGARLGLAAKAGDIRVELTMSPQRVPIW